MSHIWILGFTDSRGLKTFIGNAINPSTGRAAALRAAAAINARTGFERPHYTITVDQVPAAIICTGLDDAGLPDHRGIADILDRISETPAAL